MATTGRIVSVKVLPGQSPESVRAGAGQVCIHLFVQDAAGRFVEPHALLPALDEDGQPVKQQLRALPARGRLACDPRRDFRPRTRAGVTTITPRTDDPRAVSCPRCAASPEYAALMARLNQE